MLAEESVEDELVILSTEYQQTHGNEQREVSPANRNQQSEHTITRFGRVCDPPNTQRLCQTLMTFNYCSFLVAEYVYI